MPGATRFTTLDDQDRAAADALLDRILANTRPGPGGCWLWQGRPNGRGYGRTSSRRGRYWLVHRLVYLLAGGDLDPTLSLDHLCRVKLCCNPAHLEPVTRAENTRRWAADQAATHRGHCPTCTCAAA